jgi:hypothetical protein
MPKEESYFAQLANEILDGAEKLADRFEEGLNILWGELGSGDTADGRNHEIPADATTENEFEGWDGHGEEEEEFVDESSSPLEGIAQSVMGDIMSAQVRCQPNMRPMPVPSFTVFSATGCPYTAMYAPLFRTHRTR